MRIYVAGKDIKAGVKRNCGKCPIALALKRKVPHFTICVGLGSVEIFSDYEKSKTYSLCSKGKQFITDFDKGRKVKPFNLYLKEVIK